MAKLVNGLRQTMAYLLSGNYAVIVSIAFLCLFPVYSGYFSLKYDNIAFDLPLHYFMGTQIAEGRMPVWFDTWNMGFPLQSVFCWGVFSTIFLLFSGINSPDASIMHFELVFFIALAGVSFYKLLKSYCGVNAGLACLLACAFMLSGFTFGSSQWMFYLSGMALLPLCIYLLLQLLHRQSPRYMVLFPVAYFLFFTNTHVFISITGTYIMAGLVVYHAIMQFRQRLPAESRAKFYRWPVFAGFLLTLFICLPPLFYTLQLFPYLNRSVPITADEVVFQSDYMHPLSLVTWVLPHAALKWPFENTEGMMQSIYLGLITPLLFLLALKNQLKTRDTAGWVLLASALFFLLLSFGHYLPLRALVNYLPGFSYFRHPALFRLFFIGFLLVFAARNLPGSLRDLAYTPGTRRMLRLFVPVAIIVVLAGLSAGSMQVREIWKGSVTATIQQAGTGFMLLAGSLLQMVLLWLMLWAYHKIRLQMLARLFVIDLVLNGLFCLPFNTISSHSIGHLATVLSPVKGYPVQAESPSEVTSYLLEQDGTRWEHYNSCLKKISTDIDVYNPLTGAGVHAFLTDTVKSKQIKGQPLVFMNRHSPEANKLLFKVTNQLPGAIAAGVLQNASGPLVIQQMNFPGWTLYRNRQPVELKTLPELPFLVAEVDLNRGDTLQAEYRKPMLVFWAWLLNGLVIFTVFGYLLHSLFYRLMPFIC